MKKLATILFMMTIFITLSSCSKKDNIIPTKDIVFFSLPVWETIQPLMKKTEKMVNENNWDGLLSIKSEISTNFSTLTDVLNKIETTDPDNTSILNLHTNSWEIVSEVFNGNLSNMDNLNKLLIIDKNMTSNNEILQKYKNDLPEGYFDDLSGNSEVSEYLNNWGSMLITIIQNKILTGKEVETEK
jgi:hypothetical protein